MKRKNNSCRDGAASTERLSRQTWHSSLHTSTAVESWPCAHAHAVMHRRQRKKKGASGSDTARHSTRAPPAHRYTLRPVARKRP